MKTVEMGITITSLEELAAFASGIARHMRGGELILLSGQLGAGKTAFTKEFAQALGITEAVTSPTFTIAGEYPIKNRGRITKLVHIDLYRLERPSSDPLVLSFLEEATLPDRLTIIEWADRLADTPAGAWKFLFEVGGRANERKVTYTAPI
jgi:tRNA threonylcarbamoyladenosine biosynthesis protein TsaE